MRDTFGKLLRLTILLVLVLRWSNAEAAPLPSAVWDVPIEIASGRGNRGAWRQNESDWDYVDDPTVALGRDGTAAVAWVDQRRKDVLFQVYEPDGKPRLKTAVDVSRTPAVFSWLPRIALRAERPGVVYIAWQEIVFSGGSHGGDIMFARSQDGGATFSEPLNLSRSVGGDGKGRTTASSWDNGSLDLAVAPDGRIYVAWTEYHGTLWFSRSDDDGATFSKPTHVTGSGASPARGPSLAASGRDTVYLAWTTGENTAADICIAGSEDSGRNFGAATIAARTPDYSDAPKLAVDREGVLHLVYGERADPSWHRADVQYCRSIDNGRTFSAARPLLSPDVREARLAAFPSLALGAPGIVAVVWDVYRGPRSGGKGLAFTSSADAGQTFAAPEIIPTSADPAGGLNGSNQGKLMRKLAINESGAVAVVNSSLKLGERSRVWLMRGQLSWR